MVTLWNKCVHAVCIVIKSMNLIVVLLISMILSVCNLACSINSIGFQKKTPFLFSSSILLLSTSVPFAYSKITDKEWNKYLLQFAFRKWNLSLYSCNFTQMYHCGQNKGLIITVYWLILIILWMLLDAINQTYHLKHIQYFTNFLFYSKFFQSK